MKKQGKGGRKLAVVHGSRLRGVDGRWLKQPRLLFEVLQHTVNQVPDQGILYLIPSGAEQFQSYQELMEEGKRVAAGLRKAGLQSDDKVIFQFDRPEDFIPAFWGCLFAGIIPIPISVPSTYKKTNHTAKILLNAWQQFKHPPIITSARLAAIIHTFGNGQEVANDFQIITLDELERCKPDNQVHKGQPEDIVVLSLTSGSTGLPKVVPLTSYQSSSQYR